MLSSQPAPAQSTTTTHYPIKFLPAECAGVSTTTGTRASWIFHGDTLIAYIEHRIANGGATDLLLQKCAGDLLQTWYSPVCGKLVDELRQVL